VPSPGKARCRYLEGVCPYCHTPGARGDQCDACGKPIKLSNSSNRAADYVAQNLFAIINSRWKEAQLYFWGIQGRNEVDFIIELGQNCLAIEVKSSGRWQKKDLSGLEAFLAATPHCVAAVLGYNGTEAVRLGEKLWALPLGLVLS
jgi:hypothetical protein